MGDDHVGVVGLVSHKEDGTVGFLGDGEIQVRVAGAGVIYTTEPETCAIAFDGEILVYENRYVMSDEGFGNKGSVKGDIMVAEYGVPERGCKGGEDLSTAANCVTSGDEGERAVGDEVTGEQDEIGGEGVNVVDDALKEEGFRVLVEVDVADLDDTIAMEWRGQI
jgi:predicted TIM-barrel enzyme